MSLIYQRSIRGIKIRFGSYSDTDYVIYIGNKLYAEVDELAEGNRLYQTVNDETLAYLGY